MTVLITLLDLDFDAGSGWEPEARRALDHFLAFPVDGIVLSTPVPGTEAMLTERDERTPLVTVSELPWSRDGSVGTHSYSAGVDATRHLVALGHKRILHVAGPSSRNEAYERERGYRDAMNAAGLEPTVIAVATDWSSVSGYRAGERVAPSTFTAVFAANDELALGFMSAMERRGARAPLNYSIVGVDDMPAAAFFSPPLTTTRLDFKELGRATFATLRHHIITGERAEHLTVEPELVIRESTAPLSDTRSSEDAEDRTLRSGLRVARPEGFEPPTF